MALALSGLVVLSAIGILGMVGRSDRATNRYVTETSNLGNAQIIIRRAMQNLIAARPLPPPSEQPPDPNGDPDAQPTPSGPRNQPGGLDSDTKSILDSLFGGVDDSLPIEAAIADTTKPPNFELYFEQVIYPPTGETIYLPRLEVVTSIWPIPRTEIPLDSITDPAIRREELASRIRGTVRGVFELLYLTDGFAMAYTPIEPPGEPFILGRGFVDVLWEIMPRQGGAEGWQTIGSAYLENQFPSAVRLQLRTVGGTTADWLFETIVLTEGK